MLSHNERSHVFERTSRHNKHVLMHCEMQDLHLEDMGDGLGGRQLSNTDDDVMYCGRAAQACQWLYP